MKNIRCNYCGKKIKISNYRLKNAKNHFCNLNCKSEWQKENLCGKNNYFYNKKHTEKTKRKLHKNYTKKRIKKYRNSRLKIKNPMWKGNKVKKGALHEWIRNHKSKSKFCKKCGKITDKLELSNISGKYKRNINDFEWLCRSCHSKLHRGNIKWHNQIFKFRRIK